MRKAEQSARTKTALIEAPIGLFGERGYRASPVKAIAERAKITHGVIPFHFGSREGLLLAVVEACFTRFFDAVLAPLEHRDRDHGLGDLQALVTSQVYFSEQHPEISKVFTVLMAEAIGSSPELRPHYLAFHRRVHALGCAFGSEKAKPAAFCEPASMSRAPSTPCSRSSPGCGRTTCSPASTGAACTHRCSRSWRAVCSWTETKGPNDDSWPDASSATRSQEPRFHELVVDCEVGRHV